MFGTPCSAGDSLIIPVGCLSDHSDHSDLPIRGYKIEAKIEAIQELEMTINSNLQVDRLWMFLCKVYRHLFDLSR